MGIYLNPGNRGFWKAIRSEIYVDKTGLIAFTNKYLNTQQQYLCVSRPRRFGKSMALQMLVAYYSRGCDSAELFGGFQIEEDASFGEHLNQYDVIYLNMQQFLIEAETGKVTEYLEQEVLEELREEYGEILPEHVRELAPALRRIYARTDMQIVFLIDEWDCVMRI
ncbi:MAG: AAA family ATPase [Lachnospiraceae bacterium]|nr:AAA family ATPase [Lachnospiraceae bacterium]